MQVPTTGTIEVLVEDAQRRRLAGVVIRGSAPDTLTTRTVITDVSGTALLEALTPSAHYTVTASFTGFADMQWTDVVVRSGRITSVHEQLPTLSVSVSVVRAPAPVVDVRRALTGQDLTPQLTESLPTGRSYQSYLQLVPGVLPDSPNQSGNPASRSGVNWKDVTAADSLGVSTDNAIYIDGIDVIDPVDGTFGANLNPEMIQEQHVLTGAIPAEFAGAAGMISTVITRSGSSSRSGSITHVAHRNELAAADTHHRIGAFDARDTAFTVGGPVLPGRVWALGSFRRATIHDSAQMADAKALLRLARTSQTQGFVKGTWAPSANDMLSFTFLDDPSERAGSNEALAVTNRSRIRRQGGNNLATTYNRAGSRLLLDVLLSSHNAEITDLSADRTNRNTIAFQHTDVRTLLEEQLGGFGQDFPETRPTRGARISAQYHWKEHRVKGGYELAWHEDHRNLLYLPESDRSQYTSISNRYLGAGVTAASIANSTLWSTRQFNVTNPSDFNGVIAAIDRAPNRAAFYALYDTNGDGTITSAELGSSLIFNSTAGNPNGQVNYYRIFESATGQQDQKAIGNSFFAQDELSLGRKLTFNVGLRGEQWKHFSTTDHVIFTFDWTWSPRLSAVIDLTGNGRQKASAYWGRYYDPIRMDMTNFAGTISGSTREEQVFINDQWLTYRVRGFSPIPDGVFAPATKTPYTDELQLHYERDLGTNMSASVTYYHRQTRDIFEDFDPGLYTVAADYPGPVGDPSSLFLGWDYFGFDPNNPPAANFFLATLKGGERNYNGVEMVFRKRFSNQWQTLVSYDHLDAKGNAISDGNADFAGDVLWLDPRAPNMEGTIAGTIHHIFKTAASYTTRVGLEVGGTYRWNSGTIVNRTQLASNRRLPVQGPAFTFAGISSEPWVAAGAIGAVHNPSYGVFDARVRYIRKLAPITTEFFVDLFNVLNDQAATRVEDLVAGTGATKFQDEIQWVTPRRAFLGVRVRF